MQHGLHRPRAIAQTPFGPKRPATARSGGVQNAVDLRQSPPWPRIYHAFSNLPVCSTAEVIRRSR